MKIYNTLLIIMLSFSLLSVASAIYLSFFVNSHKHMITGLMACGFFNAGTFIFGNILFFLGENLKMKGG